MSYQQIHYLSSPFENVHCEYFYSIKINDISTLIVDKCALIGTGKTELAKQNNNE